MSELTSQLPKKTVIAWRQHLGTAEGQYGIDWLRRNYRRLEAETDAQMIRNAARWEGYMQALEDIEDRLTELKVAEKSLDEPPLDIPGER